MDIKEELRCRSLKIGDLKNSILLEEKEYDDLVLQLGKIKENDQYKKGRQDGWYAAWRYLEYKLSDTCHSCEILGSWLHTVIREAKNKDQS